jgi:hypothetical protein
MYQTIFRLLAAHGLRVSEALSPSPRGRRMRLPDDPAPEGKPEDDPEVARRPFALHRVAELPVIPGFAKLSFSALPAGGHESRTAPAPASPALLETLDGALAFECGDAPASRVAVARPQFANFNSAISKLQRPDGERRCAASNRHAIAY